MPNLFATNYPARDNPAAGVQYIAGRYTLSSVAGVPAAVKIGRIPAGALITNIVSRVVTAVTGGTSPVLGIGTTAAQVGTSGNLQNVMAEAAGTENLVPLSAFVMPLAADTDIFVGTTGGPPTAGDVVVAVTFVKPLAP